MTRRSVGVLPLAGLALLLGCSPSAEETEDARAGLDQAKTDVEEAVEELQGALHEYPDIETRPGDGAFETCADVGTDDARYVAHLRLAGLPDDAPDSLTAALQDEGWAVEDPDASSHVHVRRGDVTISMPIQGGASTVRIESECVEAPDEVAEEYVDRPEENYE